MKDASCSARSCLVEVGAVSFAVKSVIGKFMRGRNFGI